MNGFQIKRARALSKSLMYTSGLGMHGGFMYYGSMHIKAQHINSEIIKPKHQYCVIQSKMHIWEY